MHRKYVVISVVSLALAAVLVQVSAQTPPNKTTAPKSGWEYRVLLNTDFVSTDEDPDDAEDAARQIAAAEKKLNELGREGWEYSHTMHRAEIFKRPLR